MKNTAGPEEKYISKACLSRTRAEEQLTADFLALCINRGLIGLKRHRLTGGLRAGLYSGIPEEGVTALAQAMNDFEQAR